jgi:cell division protein FtsI/penicillin-binding protein 2
VRLVERRIGLLFAVFLVLLGAAALRATWLGTVKAGTFRELAVGQQVKDLEIVAARGKIVDRNGVELAVSEDAVTVVAYPFLIDNPSAVATKLAPLRRRPADELAGELGDPEKTYVVLARKLNSSAGHRVEQLGIEGIDTELEPKRTYPQGLLASQVLGLVGDENAGLSGLEFAHEETLSGENGKRRLVKDGAGQTVSLVETERSEPGEDLRLTLDAPLQQQVEAVLGELGQTYTPAGATALVMDPRSGAILAMANWPRVDANNVAGAPEYARQNRAIQASYEPGSTFKAFTVAGALEEGLLKPESRLSVPATIQVEDRVIGEAHEGGFGDISVSEVLAFSSNVGSVMVGLKLGEQRFDRWVRRFGFGKRTGVDLPGEERGIVPHPGEPGWSGASIGNLPIGQGLSVTPLQMATAYTAIAGGGLMRRPYIVQGHQSPPKRVLSKRNADRVSRMLEGVLGPGGTAEEASVEGYRLAGKTGTAEKAENGTYSKTDFVASFIGYAPARNPRLLVAVMVDEPRGEIYGGVVAAPAFERIMEFALPYLKIPPE